MLQNKSSMNLLNIVALGIGSIVGAGIFALLGQVILLSGHKAYYSFIIAGVTAMFSGYSYARLAGRYHTAGGLTDYFHIAFPEKWISGGLSVVYMLTSAISISMMAKAFGIYATELFDRIPPTPLWINSFAALLIISLAFLNMLQASDVGRSETLIAGIKMTILLVLIVVAFARPEMKLAPVDFRAGPTDFLRSIGITFFAYAGYGVITNATPYVKNPHKTIERGIFLTLGIIILFYLGLTYVVLNYTPSGDLLHNTDTAVTAVADRLIGSWGYAFMFLAAVLAFVSGINATFFSIFRISRSLGEQKVLPAIYERKFWRQGTWGNFTTTALIIAATVAFDFSSIVNLSSAAYLVSYLGIFAADWRLRKETESSPAVILVGMTLMILILVAFIVSILPS